MVQRKVLRHALEGAPGIEVIGHASNGKLALNRIALGDVDVLTLDLEMPVMGGLEVLKNLQGKKPTVGAIVVSALSQQGAQQTLEAMRLGAFDLITKPSSGESLETVVANLKRDLVPRLVACGDFVRNKRATRTGFGAAPQARPGRPPARPPRERPLLGSRPATPQGVEAPRPALPGFGGGARAPFAGPVVRPELVVLGSSTGGPQALETVLPALGADLAAPVLIVQHMPPMFTRTLAESLDRKCALKVSEAQQGQEVRRGEILIAPGGSQMRFRRDASGRTLIQITDDPPERSCKPSVDYLFRCAAETVGARALGVILTGMGDDGTAGIRRLVERGGRVIAQDEASCVVFGMPKIPVVEGLADTVLPLQQIAAEIQSRCAGGVRA